MNINFHYFAVKTIAVAAGFDDAQAQQIAKYSQFVDDYSAHTIMACSNIPEAVVSSSVLDLYSPSLRGNFRPVSTGFAGAFEYANLVVKREQRFILSPFHFGVFDETHAGAEGSRVAPLCFDDNSLIDRLLQKEIDDFLNGENQNITLMRLGMLLHVFADTYAHQMFTGFDSLANRVSIVDVVNNITGEDITNPERAGIRGFFGSIMSSIPAIGHVQAGSNPDLSHISFSFSYNNEDDTAAVHSRDNTEAFLETARNIFCYLQKCRDKPCHDYAWDEIKIKMRQGLMVERPRRNTVSSLAEHWNETFPEINYHYSSNDINRDFRLAPTSLSQMTRNAYTAYSDEFYEYNIMANQLLVALYGPKPRLTPQASPSS